MTEDLDCMVDIAAQALIAESRRYRTSPLPGPLTLARLETLLRVLLAHILESPEYDGANSMLAQSARALAATISHLEDERTDRAGRLQ